MYNLLNQRLGFSCRRDYSISQMIKIRMKIEINNSWISVNYRNRQTNMKSKMVMIYHFKMIDKKISLSLKILVVKMISKINNKLLKFNKFPKFLTTLTILIARKIYLKKLLMRNNIFKRLPLSEFWRFKT